MTRSIIKNLASSGFGKISLAGIRVIQVPVLLSFLGVHDYGRWLLLSSIPSWLAVANLGFGSVAANQMSLQMGRGDLDEARRTFSSAAALIWLIVLTGLLISMPAAHVIHWASLLADDPSRNREFANAGVMLCASVLISFWAELTTGRFRAARKAHWAILLASIRPWVELGLMVAALTISTRFDFLAGALLGSSLIYVITSQVLSYGLQPELAFDRSLVSFSMFPEFFRKGLAFQAFPIGNALLFQGSLVIVQSILGPAGVAIFGTARTMIRLVNQGMELINQSVWPELSHLLGAADFKAAARVHRLGVLASVVLAVCSILFLAACGPYLFQVWTRSEIKLTRIQLVLFLIPILFNTLWYTSSVVHIALNKHEPLAARYLILSVASAGLCYVATKYMGIEGAALSTIIVDLFLIPFVFARSLELTRDTYNGFFTGIRSDVIGFKCLWGDRRRMAGFGKKL